MSSVQPAVFDDIETLLSSTPTNPWLSFEEWVSVHENIFSPSPSSVALSLHKVSAWRSRGVIPVAVDVTASIIEIQLNDPFFRKDLSANDLQSEEMLAMLYCMAIMRLVNGFVEKTRKKNEISIAEAASLIGIPRALIDIRHECSHRDVPSLRMVRLATVKALDWLKSNYWEPERMAMPCQSDRSANLRKEIKSVIRQLVSSLNSKEDTQSKSSDKRQGVKHREHLYGRNKLLSVMAVKHQTSQSPGSKKDARKSLKKFSRLYSFSSSEVVHVFLELMLKALDSSDINKLQKGSHFDGSSEISQSVLKDWKPVIGKLLNKRQEMLPTLLKAVLQMIEIQHAVKYEPRREDLTSLDNAGSSHVERLSHIFEWVVSSLAELKPSVRKRSSTEAIDSSNETSLSKATVVDILRRCLLCCPGNKRLKNSALLLAQMTGNKLLVDSLNKLACLFDVEMDDENLLPDSPDIFISQQEDFICQADRKLEFYKLKLSKGDSTPTLKENKWSAVGKSWGLCAIGKLPSPLGSSGILPDLDLVNHIEGNEEGKNMELEDCSDKMKANWELKECSDKRKADTDLEVLNGLNSKRKKESESNDGKEQDDLKGLLMVDGSWKRVSDEDLLEITSAVRIWG